MTRTTFKIINLGLPKSGTTTLARALRSAGHNVTDHKIRRHQTKDPHVAATFVARQLYDGYYRSGDPLERLMEFDAFTEISVINPAKQLCLWPQTDFALIDAIRRRHPGTRFLASRREAADHAQSMMRWTNLGRARLPGGDVPGLPAGYGRNDEELARWIDGHHAHLNRMFEGDPAFLEFDIADVEAPEKIASFLDHPLPWWGIENANPAGTEARTG